MAYATQTQMNRSAAPANHMDDPDFTTLLDPALVRSARQIYVTYYEAHPNLVQRPIGVAINRFTHRGKLIFNVKPILLPQECFVPFSQIESDIY